MNKKIKITIALTFILVVLTLLGALVFSIYSRNESNVAQIPERGSVVTPVPSEVEIEFSDEVDDTKSPNDNAIYIGEYGQRPVIYVTNNYIRDHNNYYLVTENTDQIGRIAQFDYNEEPIFDELFGNIKNPVEIFRFKDATWVEPSSIFVDGEIIYFGTYEVTEDYIQEPNENKSLFMGELYESKIYKYIEGESPEPIWEFNTHSDKYETHSGRARLEMVQNGYAVIQMNQCFQCGPEDVDLTIIVNLETKEETTLERVSVTNISKNGTVTYQNYFIERQEAFPIWALEDEAKTLELN